MSKNSDNKNNENAKESESSLEKDLSYKSEFAWNNFSEDQRKNAQKFADDYIYFLRNARTERERTDFAIKLAEEKGFKPLKIGENITTLKPGDKVYYTNRKKNIVLFIVGKQPMTQMSFFVGSHIDSPRIDLKVHPLYENAKTGTALFKTHYYGGVKKYQWATIPLALTGVVVKADGTVVNVEIGKNPDDPVLMIPDLLIHLMSTVQAKRTTMDVIKAEEMNALAGAIQTDEEKAKKKFKLKILEILHEKYGITEVDFHSAELSLISALNPRYVGLDKSMIGGAAQDDGICAYTSLRGILDQKEIPPYTIGIGLFDKEEIGSFGNTGARSSWVRHTFNDLMVRTGIPETTTNMYLCLSNTKVLSSDVTASMDPSFPSVHDPHTASILGKGITLEKYTGARGKSSSSDATAEYMAFVRRIFEDKKIPYQIGTLGAVDVGGGGTIAMFFAEAFNCDVVDAGPGLLNMHSPFEISHIADVYSSYMAYQAFFNSK